MTIADGLAGATSEQTGRKVHAHLVAAIADKLTAQGLSAEHIGRVHKLTLTDKRWQGMHKADDGTAVVTDLAGGGLSFSFSPSWDAGPEWPVVQPARPCVVRSTKTGTVPKAEQFRTAVVWPDVQVGYRDLEGELDPFHDERAIGVAHAITRDVRPDLVILLGDFLDFPAFGRFDQEPAFQRTTQAALDRAHLLLAQIRADVGPDAEIRLIEGNHDRRLQKAIVKNAAAAFGLRQANVPDSWPVLSVPHLLRLDDLGVTYIEGYPAGVTFISDRIMCIHGHRYRSNGSSASLVADDERVSCVFGHVHSIQSDYKTRRTREGPKISAAWTPGCLCRIDGAVPSSKSSTDSRGRPVSAVEDWQQGMAVVTYEPGDGPFDYEQVFIHQGAAVFRGRSFTA